MKRAFLFLSVCLLPLASANLPAANRGGEWVSTWGTAQQLAPDAIPDWFDPPPASTEPQPPSPIPPFPQTLHDQTVRMVVRSSIGGSRLRLQLSNQQGVEPLQVGEVHIALHDKGSGIVPGSDRIVSFSGKTAFTILPGALVVSDVVDLEVPKLTELAVSLYLPHDTGPVTVHALGMNTTYIAKGNATSQSSLPDAETNRSYFWLTGIEVLAPAKSATIVAFGDSITDGYSATPDQHREWPSLLAQRLQGNAATARWSVINMGVSGNRIRRNGAGASAFVRFDRDVLDRAGVKWLVMLEGINDISFAALPRAPLSERTTADQLIEAYSQFVDKVHAHGIKIMGATLLPTEGLWLANKDTEAVRQALNQWIRSSGKLDAVVDFDKATRDPDRPARLKPEFDSGDHVHPNDAGNAAMASAIDISVFSR